MKAERSISSNVCPEEEIAQGGYALIRRKRGQTHLYRYSLRRFAIRTSCESLSVVQFSRNKFSYSCRSQWGMNTIVGSSRG